MLFKVDTWTALKRILFHLTAFPVFETQRSKGKVFKLVLCMINTKIELESEWLLNPTETRSNVLKLSGMVFLRLNILKSYLVTS